MSLTRRRLLTQNMKDMDEFILECSPNNSLAYKFEIEINKNANLPIVSAQYDNTSIRCASIDPNASSSSSIEIQGEEGDSTKTIRFSGAFQNLRAVLGTNKASTTQFKILKWYSLSNKLFEGLFLGQTIDYELTIPNHITNIDGLAFQGSIEINDAIFSSGSKLNLPDYIETISSFGVFNTFFDNATNNGDFWSVDGIVLATICHYSTATEVTIPNGTIRIATELFQKPGTFTKLTKINMPTDNLLTEIPESFCEGLLALTDFECPAGVKKIGNLAFANETGAMAITSIKFNQPASLEVSLPEAGSGTGMFYVKTARSMTIYTDNETIKNYDYDSDNITATILHLDGSTWS